MRRRASLHDQDGPPGPRHYTHRDAAQESPLQRREPPAARHYQVRADRVGVLQHRLHRIPHQHGSLRLHPPGPRGGDRLADLALRALPHLPDQPVIELEPDQGPRVHDLDHVEAGAAGRSQVHRGAEGPPGVLRSVVCQEQSAEHRPDVRGRILKSSSIAIWATARPSALRRLTIISAGPAARAWAGAGDPGSPSGRRG